MVGLEPVIAFQLRMHLTDRPDHGPCNQCAARLLGSCSSGKAHARAARR